MRHKSKLTHTHTSHTSHTRHIRNDHLFVDKQIKRKLRARWGNVKYTNKQTHTQTQSMCETVKISHRPNAEKIQTNSQRWWEEMEESVREREETGRKGNTVCDVVFIYVMTSSVCRTGIT